MRSAPKASPTIICARISSQSVNSKSLAFFGPSASFTISSCSSDGLKEVQISIISALDTSARVKRS